MRIAPAAAPPDAPVSRLNPLAKLGAALAVSLAVLASIDPVTPTVALLGVLVALPFGGLHYGRLLRRGWPVLVGAVLVGSANMLFAADQGGTTYLQLGPLHLSSVSLAVGGALGLRVLAIALPGVVAFATIDPTDLADCLVQQLRVPARFAIGALAAYRLLPLLADEWELLGLARRARGIDGGANPLARFRLFAATMFALLVGAVRRGGRLATAMDARGFDAGTPRTFARRHPFTGADRLVLAFGVLLAAAALAVSIGTGTFVPLVG